MTEPKYLAKARAYLRKQYVRQDPVLSEVNRALRILDAVKPGCPDIETAADSLHAYVKRCAEQAHPEPSIGITQHTIV